MTRRLIIIHAFIVALPVLVTAILWLTNVVDFFTPLWLLGLLGLPFFCWLATRSIAGLPPRVNCTSATLRGLLYILVVFALADIQIVLKNNGLTVFFLLDHSASIPDNILEAEVNYVNAAARTKSSKDKAGIIVFGDNASVEYIPDKQLEIDTLQSFVDREYTDVQSAVELAAAAFPDNARKKIVLLTDGNENRGDMIRAIQQAAGNGVVTDILPVDYSYPQEVLIEKVTLPDRIKENETFDLRVHATSLKGGPATLRIFRNGETVIEQAVDLEPGDNHYRIPLKIREAGFFTFTANIAADADTIPENNEASSFVYIQGDSRTLFVAPGMLEVEALARACREDNLAADVITPSQLPDSAGQLQNYDCVVLANVAADSFSQSQMELLQANVRDLGAGLVMIGGENSFGAGDYDDTPIEEALPVTMDIRQKKINPKGALAIVLHTCEFPRGNYWAKEITKKAIETVNSQDDVGVLVYDQGDRWLFELQPAENKSFMYNKINNVTPGDMPSFAPTMQLAYKGLSQSDAMVRHMIVISDGDPAAPSPQLVKDMTAAGITISTVAINPHSPRDVDIMKYLAKATGGRYYFAQDPSQLPRIFVKEARVVKRSLIFNQEFQPLLIMSTELTKGIESTEVPPLLAYVATTPKSLATVPMVSDNDNRDPVMAYWRYGLGKSVAFTSDATANWAKPWLPWDKYEKFWTQTIRWVSRKREKTDLQIRTEMTGTSGRLIIDAIDKDGSYVNFLKMSGRMLSAANEGSGLDIRQTAPGRYEAEFEAGSSGVNILHVGFENPETGQQGFVSSGVAVPYSPEFKHLESDDDLLARAAEASGGRILKPDPEADPVFESDMPPSLSFQSIWETLMVIAFALFFMDVIARRVIFSRDDLRQALATVAARVSRKKTTERDKTMDALLTRKKKTFEKTESVEPSADFQESLRRKAASSPASDDVRRELEQQARPGAGATESAQAKPAATSPDEEDDSYTGRLLAAKRRAARKPSNQNENEDNP